MPVLCVIPGSAALRAKGLWSKFVRFEVWGMFGEKTHQQPECAGLAGKLILLEVNLDVQEESPCFDQAASKEAKRL